MKLNCRNICIPVTSSEFSPGHSVEKKDQKNIFYFILHYFLFKNTVGTVSIQVFVFI